MAYTDPYRVLGLNFGATQEQIKEAYREMAKKYHPDHYTDPNAKELAEEKMAEINRAYDQLTSGNKYSDSNYGGNAYGPGPGGGSQWQNQGNPWGNRQSPWGNRGTYYRQSRNDNCCQTLTCLCCADSCCECMGGDLVPCC